MVSAEPTPTASSGPTIATSGARAPTRARSSRPARRGPRPPMVVGLALAGAGLLLLARVGARAPLVAIVGPLLAVGVGSALTMPAMTAAVIEHTPRARAGIGSAVLNASRQVGGVVGIALLGALIGTHGARGE